QAQPWGVDRHHAAERVVTVLCWHWLDRTDEKQVRKDGRGADHLRSLDDEAAVSLGSDPRMQKALLLLARRLGLVVLGVDDHIRDVEVAVPSELVHPAGVG